MVIDFMTSLGNYFSYLCDKSENQDEEIKALYQYKEDFDDIIFGTLKNIQLSNAIIRNYVFYGLMYLEEIYFLEGVREIGMYISNSEKLKTIYLSNSVRKIDETAFIECKNLENIIIDNEFKCNNLNISASTKYTHETLSDIISKLKNLAYSDPYTLIIGKENMRKLTKEDKRMIKEKNWIFK